MLCLPGVASVIAYREVMRYSLHILSQEATMTKKQIQKALADHKEREQAKRSERIVVPGYPYSHNPYLKHAPVEDCFSGCVHE